jgi:hypothetical protein
MNEPARWSQEPLARPAAAEVLLRATRRPRPPGADDLARLGAVVAQIPRRSALVARRWSRFATAATAAIVVACLGTTVWALRGHRPERADTPPAPVSLARLEPAEPSAAAEMAPPQAPPLEPASPKAPVRRRSGSAAGGERRTRAIAAADAVIEVDGLNREIALIDDARANVGLTPARALDTLDRHRREFPRGQLAAEREFLAIEALRHLNRIDEARRRADALRIDYPSSSYAARAARLLPPAP